MWNLIAINPICQRKKLTSDQERLLVNINCVKKRIDNNQPWRPSHSLSKWSNKYTHQQDEKIVYQNNILLNKMMDIQKHQSRSASLIPTLQQSSRKFEKLKINQENQQFLRRLQSAQSSYTRKFWQVDDEKNQTYKALILKRTKINDDYDDLARKQLESRISTTRNIACILYYNKKSIIIEKKTTSIERPNR
ncbi:hypothetical protein pb186bvf_018370 [Paramecium bursaria]